MFLDHFLLKFEFKNYKLKLYPWVELLFTSIMTYSISDSHNWKDYIGMGHLSISWIKEHYFNIKKKINNIFGQLVKNYKALSNPLGYVVK